MKLADEDYSDKTTPVVRAADALVAFLFRNGDGEIATILQMRDARGQYLGGWSPAAVRGAAVSILRSLGVASLALLLCAASVRADEARDRKAAGILLAGFGFAASVDMLQTSYCLGARFCTEANPVLRYNIERFGVVPALSVKGAVHTGTIYLLARARAKAPRAVKWVAVGLLAAQIAVDVHNYRELRR